MAKLKEHKFHSRELLPLAIVESGSDAIVDFEETGRSIYKFSTGEEVVHKQDLSTRMVVQEIVRKARGKEKASRLDGILCHWWESKE